MAFAAVMLGAGLFTYHEYAAAKRTRFAQSVAAVTGVASLPGPEILQDFDTIRQLGRTPPADEELLTLMQ